MIKILSKFISLVKNEEFTLDGDLPTSYLVRFLMGRALAYIKSIRIFKTFRLAFVGKRCSVLASNLMTFHDNLSIADDCHIDALSRNGIRLGRNVSIQKRVVIECSGSLKFLGEGLIIGDNVGIGSGSFLGCAGGVEIGDETILGNFVSFHSENHNFSEKGVSVRLQGVSRKGIQIGKNCWIGAKATVLDGTTLGDGCVVAAGAVLNGKSYPDNSIVAGVPARIIKKKL